jgi:hypothetical protein
VIALLARAGFVPISRSKKMKKSILIGVLIWFLTPFSAVGNQINVLGGVGFAFDDVRGVAFELGVEFRLTRGFYLQLTADTYLDDRSEWWDDYIIYYGGIIYYPQRLSTRPYGANIFGTYKFPISKNWTAFAKVGVHAAFYLQSYYDDYTNYSGPKKEGIGTAVGIGLEHRLTERLALVIGGTYKMLFDADANVVPALDNSHWFKLDLGLNYQITGLK